MKIFCTGTTDVGNRSGVNQDAIGLLCDGKKGMFIVADGMGGHEDGEFASHHIVSKMEQFWKKWLQQEWIFQEMVLKCKKELLEENRFLYEKMNRGKVCGTTLVILLIDGTQLATISIGDSRIYVNENEIAMALTTDDIWDTIPEIQKMYSEDEMRLHPNHGKLTQAFGSKQDPKLHMQIGTLQKDTGFLLMSDGIYQYCRKESINHCIAEIMQPARQQSAIEKLIREVTSNGAKDNYSCIAVTIKDLYECS